MEQRTKARALRGNATATEVRLWRAISARKVEGVRFNRQVPIGPFICDFVARSRKLIIEVDGETHGNRREQDEERTRYLQSEGYQVIRFWNNDVLGNLEGVMHQIEQALAALPSPSPSRKREGSFGHPFKREGSF
ncbi:MAG: endonuclease domain-containing protein [Sphingomonas sp.]|jgi:very-short-patch-repair endonuclease|uniref:endonuclease domain-containing protein n=1 Tax=Sphingomonas sp. TaxID=28214 RepID=UPI0035618711